MQRIEHHLFPAVGVARNDLTAIPNLNHIYKGPDSDITETIGAGKRVIVGLVAHQRLLTDTASRFGAGLIGCA